ncbi:MAG TPA: chlorite dismutase family protein [Armatimonadota bacterium]
MRPPTQGGEGQPGAAQPEAPRQFVNFNFFTVDPAWRRLPEGERVRGKREFGEVLESFRNREVLVYSYSTQGIHTGSELCLWRIGYRLEDFQEMTAQLLGTGLGTYLKMDYSLLGQTRRSLYVDKISPEHEASRLRVVPGRYKYLFIYPFVKTRAWYKLTLPARQGMMDEHIQIGNKYPSVKLNTIYSFGLDDQEFVVAFETDHPEHFLDLVMELRSSEASQYTLRDTPIFTCVRREDSQALDLLGG